MSLQHGGADRQSTSTGPATVVAAAPAAQQQGPRTAAQIILDYFRERYEPAFRCGTAVHTASGGTIQMGEATVVCDSRLIDLLESATDAPRYAGKNGPGEVKRSSLPGFFKTWAKVAWGDLLGSLPDEDGADLGCASVARDEFKRLVREALLTEITLGDKDEREVERRSLIDWCVKFAKAGPWRSIRSKKLWCKVELHGGGELKLKVALRHELFAQVRADPRLREMGANTFTRRAARYGVGQSSREDRPHGQSAIVLNDDFIADLTTGLLEVEAGAD
ncbi:MAG: hypothetical protein FJ304_20835 [Planctomycetes bacterium]|nr:hypothetical protein [Planctomycetota bacterium]